MSCELLRLRKTKKSESPHGGSVLTSWQLNSTIFSSDVNALAASMYGEITHSIDGDALHFSLFEHAANDMRAMWNTRMRSIVSVEAVLKMVKDSIHGEQPLSDGE